MRENWATAIGYEIENKRMMGKLTIFVYDKPIPIKYPVDQIFFTEEYITAYGWGEVSKWVDVCEVTIQIQPSKLYLIPDDLRRRCHLCIDISAIDWFKYTKPSDTLKLTTGDWCTATVTIEDMVTTQKSDYRRDMCSSIKGEADERSCCS